MLQIFEEKIKESPVEWKKFTVPSLLSNYSKLSHRITELNKVIEDQEINTEEYIKERYNYTQNAKYLSEEERGAMNFNMEKIEFAWAPFFDKIFNHIEELSIDYPETCIRLYIQLALLINNVDSEKAFDDLQYEVCSEALELFQDEISDSREKVKNYFFDFLEISS